MKKKFDKNDDLLIAFNKFRTNSTKKINIVI